uniref:RBR-type E3 ubiquitin transferase n=1 Tax=Oryza barthii TaxID=65489 RepID=A0A0D3FFW5_9ORYZ
MLHTFAQRFQFSFVLRDGGCLAHRNRKGEECFYDAKTQAKIQRNLAGHTTSRQFSIYAPPPQQSTANQSLFPAAPPPPPLRFPSLTSPSATASFSADPGKPRFAASCVAGAADSPDPGKPRFAASCVAGGGLIWG